MTLQVSSRDWETLSAYLDGQLSSKERARLETRLNTDPDLQQALQELRRTRAVVRSLPKMRAPRNYSLTPQMAGIGREPESRIYPLFRFASLLASLLFVLVVAGDYLVAQRFSPSALPTGQTVEAPMAAMEAAPEGTPPGIGGGFGAEEEAPEEPAEMEARGSDLTEEGESESMEAFGLEAGPTETVESPSIGPAAPELQASEPPSEILAADQVREEQVRRPFGLSIGGLGIFRIAEIALALVAIVTGLVAVYLRRGFQQ